MLLSVSSGAGIAIDVLIVALIAVFALIGFKKGFFKSVLSMVSTLVVIIVSVLCASPVAKLINKIYDFTGLIAGKLCKGIASMGAFYSQTIPEGVSGQDLVNNIPSSTNGFLKKLMSHVLKPLSAGDVEGATVADIVSGAFASIIMTIIAGILLFILIKIIIALASRLFDNITRNRVFGVTNKLFGLAFGAAKGFIIVIIFAIVMTLLTVIPFVNNKVSPILQDHSKIARPIYNYTDEMMEKYIVDGKVVQKWVDNLWENKYKDRGDDNTTPNGTASLPYNIELTESEGLYTATISVDFSSSDNQYYKIVTDTVSAETFALTLNMDSSNYEVYLSSDINTALSDLTSLDKSNEYVIKFIKPSDQTGISVTITITPILT